MEANPADSIKMSRIRLINSQLNSSRESSYSAYSVNQLEARIGLDDS